MHIFINPDEEYFNLLFCQVSCVLNMVLSYNPGWPETPCAVEASLKLSNLPNVEITSVYYHAWQIVYFKYYEFPLIPLAQMYIFFIILPSFC